MMMMLCVGVKGGDWGGGMVTIVYTDFLCFIDLKQKIRRKKILLLKMKGNVALL